MLTYNVFCSISSNMGDTSDCKQSQSKPQQPSRVLLHHPPSAAGSGLWGAQLTPSHRHGARGSPEAAWQWWYNLYQEYEILFKLFFFTLCSDILSTYNTDYLSGYRFALLFDTTLRWVLNKDSLSHLGSLTRDQRRVWFADGVLPNGDTTDSSKTSTSSPAPSQSNSNKSSTSESSEVSSAWKAFSLN